MNTSVMSLTGSGIADWVVQRVSAVILAAYTLLILGALVLHPNMTFAIWSGLFGQTWMKLASMTALLALVAHTWIGMWTLGTDYIRPHYFGRLANPARLVYQVLFSLVLLVYLLWGAELLWGV